mmetsp:Transcript_18038/g.29900  ORF Transcript_18038/g.29900 Transcript_18038/m.29900 type:complete len:85 (-) Transcript_18038:142-396(-)
MMTTLLLHANMIMLWLVVVVLATVVKSSKEERQAWNIPVCILNWENARGYTILLDTRLGADRRGLCDETTTNYSFGLTDHFLGY